MKLDRNMIVNNGRGKYALLKLRDLAAYQPHGAFETNPVAEALTVLEQAGLIEWGYPRTEGEFFVIKLRDQYAQGALAEYATRAAMDDKEYAAEVLDLAFRAGPASKFCKRPD